jgi:hypothetical protein
MTFLELCQAVARDVGVADASLGNVPTSVTGQTGELRRIVGYVQNAAYRAQAKKYDFLREEVTMTIAPSSNVAAGTVPANRYVKDGAYYIQTGASGRFWLDYLRWEDFRYEYDATWLAQNREPSAWTIRPGDNGFVVNAVPVGAPIVIYVERFKNPVALVDNADVPPLPADLHQVIVELAKIYYANYDEAGAMRQTAQAEVTGLLMQIDARCLPEITLGGTLLDE